MKFTKFYHPGCGMNFYVRYALEQNASDVDYCPSCGERDRVIKEGVIEMDGLIVSKSEITED